MGRPRKNTNTPGRDPFFGMNDDVVLKQMKDRFDVMDMLSTGSINGNVRGLIISGAPGIGKTYNIETQLQKHQERNNWFRYKSVKGIITPINLFKTLQDYRHPGNVVVLDDADSIFFDDVGVNILKAALDSGTRRVISWLSESHALKDGEHEYDREFEYNGTMVFITNTDFQSMIDEGKNKKIIPHLEALMSRSIYLDLQVHTRRSVSLWVKYIVEKTNMLVNNYGLTKSQQQDCVNWMLKNQNNMRTLSLRDIMKVGQIYKSTPLDWERICNVLLLRSS